MSIQYLIEKGGLALDYTEKMSKGKPAVKVPREMDELEWPPQFWKQHLYIINWGL